LVKWNIVFRLKDSKRVQPGACSFRSYVVVGDRKDMVRLLKEPWGFRWNEAVAFKDEG